LVLGLKLWFWEVVVEAVVPNVEAPEGSGAVVFLVVVVRCCLACVPNVEGVGDECGELAEEHWSWKPEVPQELVVLLVVLLEVSVLVPAQESVSPYVPMVVTSEWMSSCTGILARYLLLQSDICRCL
jgi:hypothetical protein